MTSGGKRLGAGRPRGSNIYGEPTIPLRVPQSRVEEIKEYLITETHCSLPLFSCTVRAGTPTVADDSIDQYINLHSHLINNPKATFLVKASGDSMIKASINDGDMLVVDKSIAAANNHIVVAAIEGNLTVKRLAIHGATIQLNAENEAYPPIMIRESDNFLILGVVTHVIHRTI